MADTQPTIRTADDVLADLPARVRVYALAKALGLSTKDTVVGLAARGVAVKTAASTIDRDDARPYIESLLSTEGQGEAAETTGTTTSAMTRTSSKGAKATKAAKGTTAAKRAKAAKSTKAANTPPTTKSTQATKTAKAAKNTTSVSTSDDPPQLVDVTDELAAEVFAELADIDAPMPPRESAEITTEAQFADAEPAVTGADITDTTDTDASAAVTEHAEETAPAPVAAIASPLFLPPQPVAFHAPSSDPRDTTPSTDDEDEAATPQGRSRRRRRGRRGKGTGSGADNGTDNGAGGSGAAEEAQSTSTAGDSSASSGNVRGIQETEVDGDIVKGISGSTRLEAKRQRRREQQAQDSRRRSQGVTEEEFLARREAVTRTMVVREKDRSDHPGTTTQVGVLEDGVLVEHYVTSDTQASMVGNIYLGTVENVLSSLEACFVDIGGGRNAILYAGDVDWKALGKAGRSRRINKALKTGDQVLVQVTKDPVDHKGARLTMQISLAGRFLVYVPEGHTAGISRKLPEKERKRLKSIVKGIIPSEASVIIRTAAEGATEESIGRDVHRLRSLWGQIVSEAEKAKASKKTEPVTLHREPGMLIKVVRDLFNEDFSKLIVQGGRAYNTVHNYIDSVSPELLDRVERFTPTTKGSTLDVFEVYRIDTQLAKALARKVDLPSGGSLVIDRTEAMTVIDVNTGKFTGSGVNLEELVTRNNLEAADEVARQLRLRDIGGIVIIDFIDMILEDNRELVLRRLREALENDRTRHNLTEVTSLGLVQMTRKRISTGLIDAFSTCCPTCQGRGIVIHDDPVEAVTRGENWADTRTRRRRDDDAEGPSASTQRRPDAPAPSEHPMVKAMDKHSAAASEAVDDEFPEDSDAARSASSEGSSASDADTAGDGGQRRRRRRGSRRVSSAELRAPRPSRDAEAQETRDAEETAAEEPVKTAAVDAKASTLAEESAEKPAARGRRTRHRAQRPASTVGVSTVNDAAADAVKPEEETPIKEYAATEDAGATTAPRHRGRRRVVQRRPGAAGETSPVETPTTAAHSATTGEGSAAVATSSDSGTEASAEAAPSVEPSPAGRGRSRRRVVRRGTPGASSGIDSGDSADAPVAESSLSSGSADSSNSPDSVSEAGATEATARRAAPVARTRREPGERPRRARRRIASTSRQKGTAATAAEKRNASTDSESAKDTRGSAESVGGAGSTSARSTSAPRRRRRTTRSS